MNSIDALIASIDAVSLTNSQDRYPHHTNKAESGHATVRLNREVELNNQVAN